MYILNPLDIKKKALNSSLYSHQISQDKPTALITLSHLDFPSIRSHIQNDPALLNFNTTHKPIILEILDLLEQYNNDYVIDQYKHIGFYLNGIPLVRIHLDSLDNLRELHISLHRYTNEKSRIETDNRTNKLFIYGITGSFLIGGIMTAVSFFKNK